MSDGAASMIEPVNDHDFAAEAIPLEDGGLSIALGGTADLNVKSQLDDFLAAVHAYATVHQPDEVLVDLRKLEFINSSCLKSFIVWIHAVQSAERPYHIVFSSNASAAWQRRTLYPLACMAADLVTIQN